MSYCLPIGKGAIALVDAGVPRKEKISGISLPYRLGSVSPGLGRPFPTPTGVTAGPRSLGVTWSSFPCNQADRGSVAQEGLSLLVIEKPSSLNKYKGTGHSTRTWAQARARP